MADFHFYLKGITKSNSEKIDPWRSKKPCLIYLKRLIGSKRFVISTGIKVAPLEWDRRHEKIKPSVSNSLKRNQELKNFLKKAEDAYYELCQDGRTPSAELLRSYIKDPQKESIEIKPLIKLWEEYLEKMKNGSVLTNDNKTVFAETTIKKSKSAMNHFKAYLGTRKSKVFLPEQIAEEEYSGFIKHLIKKDCSQNTVRTHVKYVRFFLNYLIESKICPSLNLSYFKLPKEEATESIYLTEEEIELLAELDLTDNPKLQRVRDLFLIGCWTGLRFSDLCNLKRENIKGEILTIRMIKTGDLVTIPIVNKGVYTILDKYDGSVPEAISNQKTNFYLKEIGQMIGIDEEFIRSFTKGGQRVELTKKKWEMLTTHTARRSFATNLYKRGIPSFVIMQVTGHKSEASFLKYIRIGKEEAAQRILSYFKDQPPKDDVFRVAK